MSGLSCAGLWSAGDSERDHRVESNDDETQRTEGRPGTTGMGATKEANGVRAEEMDEIDFLIWKIRIRDKLDELRALNEKLKALQEGQNGEGTS